MTDPSPSAPSPSRTEDGALGAFELDPEFLHLNHGSYGAVPRAVRLEQDRWRAAIERNPTGFFQDELPGAMRRMARLAAQRLGGRSEDWVFCENATAAVNAVLHSLDLRPGDELLTTSHAYGAVLKAMALVADRRGASLRIVELPAILEDEEQILQAIGAAFAPRTRLLIVDHITSATAVVLPVKGIAARARAAGVPVLIDGAHGPGQIAFDAPALGADWYTGNAHKWQFAPRGCGLLWTMPARQAATRPPVLSHGADQGYTAAFDWIGTRDPSPWLAFEAAALAHDRFGGRELMARNVKLAAGAARELATALRARAAAPTRMRAAMAALWLGEWQASDEVARNVRRALADEHRIMVPVHFFAGRLWLRISAQIYNTATDYERLIRACRVLLPRFAAP
ncbi:MAG TPA: aminotransferase class V-fold PLP-dependent enzyme [Rhizomicrobium sp.]